MLDFTKDEFAEVVGVIPETVRRWEQRVHAPSPLARRRLYEVEEYALHDLLPDPGVTNGRRKARVLQRSHA